MPTGIYDHSKNKGFTGKHHSPETRRRMSEMQQIAQRERREMEQEKFDELIGVIEGK